jgi:CBS domain-containing protein
MESPYFNALAQKERLANIRNSLLAGQISPKITVRTFLDWFFKYQRRTPWIVSHIRKLLNEAAIRTQPDFESTYLDAEICFELVETVEQKKDTGSTEIAEKVSVSDHAEVRVVSASFADPTYRVSKLAAANQIPTSVQPDSTITEAVTLMISNDYSQLPVMTNEREVKGIVSWKTIGSRLALGKHPSVAREAMEPHAQISSDASLFMAIPLIVQHEYVLVRGSDRRIVGIVTTTDLSLQFQQMTEPFLLLGEIENHIRRLIDSHFDKDELSAVKDSSDGQREVSMAADLTFGEYKHMLEDPGRWQRLGLNIDRVTFIKMLDKVRELRNDVMHFDPDGIPEDDLDVLRNFAHFLRTLQSIGVT